MIHSDSIILNFSSQLDHAQNFEACFDILTKAAKFLGFDGALYMYTPIFFTRETVQFTPIMKISDDYGSDYLAHYQQHQYIKHDHMIQVAVNGENRLIDWFEDVENLLLPSRSVEVLEVARDYGIQNGYSFPTLLSEHAFAAASFVCRQDDTFFSDVCQSNIHLMKVLTNLFHAKVISEKHYQHIFITPFLDQLSPTKIAVLTGLASGQHIKTISTDLGVSNKYIQNLMADIRKDFGNVSRDRLMYLLGALTLDTAD